MKSKMDKSYRHDYSHRSYDNRRHVDIMVPRRVSAASNYKPPYYPESESSGSSMMSSDQMCYRPFQIAMIVFACLAFLVTIFFNFLFGYGQVEGIFATTVRNGLGAVSSKYSLEVTPAGWTFGIWIFIYVAQALFLSYALSTICRRGPTGGYLYFDNQHIPIYIYAIYTLNLGLNVAWLFLWDREMLHATLAVLFLVAATLVAILVILTNRLAKYGLDLIRANLLEEIWLVTLAAHNGLAMYATWTVLATTLNLGIVLTYLGDLQDYIASSIILAIVSLIALFYCFADFFLVDRQVRYIFTPYVVAIVFLSGVVSKDWDKTKVNFLFAATLLGVVAFLSLVKIILTAWRFVDRPVFDEEKSPPKPEKADNRTFGLFPHSSIRVV